MPAKSVHPLWGGARDQCLALAEWRRRGSGQTGGRLQLDQPAHSDAHEDPAGPAGLRYLKPPGEGDGERAAYLLPMLSKLACEKQTAHCKY
jgi:hypothetical protein